MILKFVDREEELKALKSLQTAAIIYGRRRVGKTALIKEFIKDRKAFYFLCQKNKIEAEFERFLNKFNRAFSRYIEAKNFEEFFESIKKEEMIIVLDEFSYWVEKNPGIPSLFQYIIDEILREGKIKIIFCGSLISTMESQLSYKNPLYGRIKLKIKLEPLKFKFLKEFLPKYSLEDLIKVYSCVGGIPAYLQEFDKDLSVYENLDRLFFNKFGFLYEDAERLLKDELREPEIYFRIIESIASGETTLGKISSKAFVSITDLPKYLRTLKKMRIVKEERSVLGKNKVIRIVDNYFRFWIKFVHPFREEIELGIFSFPEEKFNTYLGEVFEEVCKEFLIETRFFPFTKIGKWWHKDKEIDLVGLNERTKEILFSECKWKDRVSPKKILEELVEKSQYVQWHNKERKESFAIFAKSFSKRIDEFEGKKVYCFDLKDLERLLK